MKFNHPRRGAIVAGACLLALSLTTGRAPAADIDYPGFVAEKDKPLVTLKYILKVSMGGGGGAEESEAEAPGLLISGDGLVICSNTELGGFVGLMTQMMPGAAPNIQPREIKVLIGDDDEGVEATLVARDTDLDLAWIKIDEPAETPYAHVDFSKAASVKVGEPLVMVYRMPKHFDRLPVFSEFRVAGLATKPRDLIIPGAAVQNAGLPVYNTDGVTVGIVIVQLPDAGGDQMDQMSFLEDMMSASSSGGVILPAENVVKATKRARATLEDAPE